jgi:prepilin-type N-terminal cleavage/methylation domain-containing protein
LQFTLLPVSLKHNHINAKGAFAMFHKLKNVKDRSEGFTIIEVLIVLAIAGLIILIVFLAVPALQRNSRNTRRKSDASHLAGLVNEYVANNNGKVPTGIGTGANLLDLTKENFAILDAPTAVQSGITTLGTLDKMEINTGAICSAGVATAGGGTRSFTVTYMVEKGDGTGVAQCV